MKETLDSNFKIMHQLQTAGTPEPRSREGIDQQLPESFLPLHESTCMYVLIKSALLSDHSN